MQRRAEVTRKAILDTAIEMFDEYGYANVSLMDLMSRAGASKGAFYYHFTNREGVAEAIIGQSDDLLREVFSPILSDLSAPVLENFVRVVFAIADLTTRNSMLRIGIQLRGCLGHVNPKNRELFTRAMSACMAQGDLRPDLDADRLAHTLWAAILGTYQQCAATGEDLRSRLADVLLIILPAICSPDVSPRYLDLVNEVAVQDVG
mgnify:CR=1 FL=1